MIRLVLYFILISGIQLNVYSQENSMNKVSAKEWSLSFGIDKDFTLKNFQGSTISISKYISANEEIRFAFSNNMNGRTTERNIKYFTDDKMNASDKSEGKNNPKSFSVICQYQNHFHKRGNITAYFSTGPSFSHSSSFSENESTIIDGSNSISKNISNYDATNVSFGLMNSLGVEWDFHQSLSLHAEYQIYTGYSWGNSIDKSTYERIFSIEEFTKRVSESKLKSSGWEISNSNVLFGVSVLGISRNLLQSSIKEIKWRNL